MLSAGAKTPKTTEDEGIIISKKLNYLEPNKKHIEIIEGKRVGNSVGRLLENAKLALVIAAHCGDTENAEAAGGENVSKHKLLCDELALAKRRGFADWRLQKQLHSTFKSSMKQLIEKYRASKIHKGKELIPLSNSPQSLIESLEEIFRIAYERLKTTPEEQRTKIEYLSDVMKRLRRSHDSIIHMEEELQEKLSEKEHEVSVQDLKLSWLTVELENAKKYAENEHQKIQSDASKQIQSENRYLEMTTADEMEKIVDLRSRLQSNRSENYRNETTLRKKRYKLITELQNWITKYDDDLDWRQEQIEELHELQELNQADLKELETQFTKLEVKYKEIMEERYIKAEKKRKLQEELRKQVGAAIMLQAFWRGYVARQTLAGRVVGGGKRAKGKKKKGKKK